MVLGARRVMKRFLSHILLFALLVVSPFSFTTPEIPSIYISVTINAPVQESKKNRITVAHRLVQTVPASVFTRFPDKTIIPLPTLPAKASDHEIEHGRAPPVVPTV